MKLFIVVSCLLLVISCSALAIVDLTEIGVGARPLGMGKAYVGGVDDATSIFTNPAGLAQNPNLNIISMSGSLLMDVNYMLIGASDITPLGKFGIGYVNASVGSIPIMEITGSGSESVIVQTDSTDYSSSIILFSYGTKLSRFLRGRGDNISFGGSLKYFLQGFSGGGTTMQDATGTGMDADIGLIWEMNRWAKLGFTLSNCLSQDLGGKFVWHKNKEVESIPAVFRSGGEFKILGKSAIRENENHELRLLLDYETARDPGRPAVWHAGIEYSPLKVLALRIGIDQKPKATEAGTGVDDNLTLGVGLKYLGFTFDYAYHQFGELAENTSHFFSIGYRGEEEEEEVYEKKKLKKEIAVPLPEVVPKPKLKTFIDLPEGHWARKPIQYLATLGIMGGYPDQTFRPERELTRGELAVILVKAKGFKTTGVSKTGFDDVRPRDWAAPYIEVVVRRKYMRGYPDGSFRPNQRVSRAEAALIFSRFSGLYTKSKVRERVFPDVKKSHWASPAIAATKGKGYFEYLSGKDFQPSEYLTRAEAAEILSKTPTVKETIKKLISEEK
jgi:hypothetical protein